MQLGAPFARGLRNRHAATEIRLRDVSPFRILTAGCTTREKIVLVIASPGKCTAVKI